MPPTIIKIDEVFVVSKDIIRLTLSGHISNDTAYNSTLNYEVFNLSGGTNGIVVRVIPTSKSTTDEIYLQLNNMKSGDQYKIEIAASVMHTFNGAFAVFTEKKWTMHKTKTDSALEAIPRMYDKSIGSNFRSIIESITISDEKIGGDY